MNARTLVPFAALTIAALAMSACGDNKTPSATTGGATAKTTAAKPKSTTTAKPKVAAFGTGVIKGTVKFSGVAQEMKVPKKRAEAEFCKDTEIKYNAVNCVDGKLQDVFVSLTGVSGDYEPTGKASIDQKGCMYTPRIQGVMIEQEFTITNSDATLHNVNAGRGTETLFNTAQPKGAPALTKSFEEAGIYRLKCDVHSWMRSFVVVTENPFHAVTGADGIFSIAKVPAGKYKLEAWHSQFGKKVSDVTVKDGEVTVDFEYDGTEAEPSENKGELKDLF